jgi:two-component system OmpR family response regulator
VFKHKERKNAAVERLALDQEEDERSKMPPQILFVDDETALGEMLSLYFGHKGFAVTTAGTVEQAMSRLEERPFDLVVLDLNLAGQDGLEVLRFVKSHYEKTPVVVFTGLDVDENLVKTCLADRADGFMRKTDGLEKLFAEVQRHLHN